VGTTTSIVDDNQYVEASEDVLRSTAWKARKKICLNCVHLLTFLRGMSGEDYANYTDQWHALKGTYDLYKLYPHVNLICLLQVEHDGNKEIHDHRKTVEEKKARLKAAEKAKEKAATVRSKRAAIRAKRVPEQILCSSCAEIPTQT
jgi:hypothetical protein